SPLRRLDREFPPLPPRRNPPRARSARPRVARARRARTPAPAAPTGPPPSGPAFAPPPCPLRGERGDRHREQPPSVPQGHPREPAARRAGVRRDHRDRRPPFIRIRVHRHDAALGTLALARG